MKFPICMKFNSGWKWLCICNLPYKWNWTTRFDSWMIVASIWLNFTYLTNNICIVNILHWHNFIHVKVSFNINFHPCHFYRIQYYPLYNPHFIHPLGIIHLYVIAFIYQLHWWYGYINYTIYDELTKKTLFWWIWDNNCTSLLWNEQKAFTCD